MGEAEITFFGLRIEAGERDEGLLRLGRVHASLGVI